MVSDVESNMGGLNMANKSGALIVLCGGLIFHAQLMAIEPKNDSDDFFSGKLTTALTATTDYVFVGRSNTRGGNALQASVNYIHESGIYAQIWTSNIDFGLPSEGQIEIDYSLGYQGKLNDFDYSATFRYYSFPDSDNKLELDFPALLFTAGHPIGPVYLFSMFGYTPNFAGSTDDTFALESKISVPVPFTLLPIDWSVDAGIARLWVEDNERFRLPDYNYWNFGTKVTYKNVTADLRYYDTDVSERICEICEDRVVFSLSMIF